MSLGPIHNQNKDLDHVPPTGQVVLGYPQIKHIKEQVLKVTDNFTEQDYEEYLKIQTDIKEVKAKYVNQKLLQEFKSTRKIDEHFVRQFLHHHQMEQEDWDMYYPHTGKYTDKEEYINTQCKHRRLSGAFQFFGIKFQMQVEFDRLFKMFKEELLPLSTEELEEFLNDNGHTITAL